jgi:ArsR family transcriptional regulator
MKSMAQFFKLFSDETRLRCIYLIIKNKSICVCELTYALQLSQPKISRHLTFLRNLGVIIDERKGKWVYYSINPQLQQSYSNILSVIFQELKVTQQAKKDQSRLKNMNNRPGGLNYC